MRTLSKILGPDGKPYAGNLFPSPRNNPRLYRPRARLNRDTKRNVNAYDRAELVDISRKLRAQIDEVYSAVLQKNSWAFGDAWSAHYTGRNKAWGEEAAAFLREQFYPLANVRGRTYNFRKSLRLSGEAWDTDGDDLMVLTESAAGFPQLAFYTSENIGSGTEGKHHADGLVIGGQYDGAKIHDGVIMDRADRMIAVRILGENETVTDISSFSCDLSYEPNFHDQGRGIPRLAVSVLRWMNLQDIDEFLQRGLKRASAVGLKFKTKDGEPLGNAQIVPEEVTSYGGTVIAGATTSNVRYEEVAGGEAYYLDAESGEEIEALNFQNPHPNVEAFIARLIRGSLASLGWSYDLLNIGSTSRAPTRMVCDLANQSIWDRQSTGELRAQRAVSYAIAKAMKNGYLSKNTDGMDPYRWEFGLPAQLTVDSGNEEAADRENLKIGTTSKTIIAAKKGYHEDDIRRHRKAEIVRNSVAAAEIETETGGKIPFDKALEMLEQRSANPVAQAPAPAEPDTDDEEDPAKE